MIEVRITDKMALSTAEAGRLANTGINNIRAAINAGELKAYRHGRRMIVLREDLEAWLRHLPKVMARG